MNNLGQKKIEMDLLKFLFALIIFLTVFSSKVYSQKIESDSLDSIEIDFDYLYPYVSDLPPVIKLDELPKPTLFIVNGRKTKASTFSELRFRDEVVEKIEINNIKSEINKMGLSGYNSVVKITTTKQ